MKPQEYNDLADKIWNDLKVIRDKKSHDYASNEDTLRNFKVTATILGQLGFQVKGEEIKSSDVALFFEVIKMCRRANLRGRQPDNESVLDSVEDNVNYTCLQYACLLDENKSPVTQQEIQQEVGIEFDNKSLEEEYVNGYERWCNSNGEPGGVIYIEKPNWKVKGLLEVGKSYQAAKDSSVVYNFLGKEADSGLYIFSSDSDLNPRYFTNAGLDMLDLVEVPNV